MTMLRPIGLAIASLCTTACLAQSAKSPVGAPVPLFAPLTQLAVNGVAEIIAATPDGLTLVYTSADAGRMGLVDIRKPEQPVSLTGVDVRIQGVGEPTSVAISPDGRFAVLAVRLGDDRDNHKPGVLRVYDIRQPQAVRHVKDITVGTGPDSLALVGQGRTLRAVVAIEDEETDDKGDATLDGKRPGHIEVVGLQDLYGGRSSGVQTIGLVAALQALPGAIYPMDPQPEFVSIDKAGTTAVVSLQENNAFAIVDLSDPRQARLERVVSAGAVTRQGDADLKKDKNVLFQDSLVGRREPDAVAWVMPGVFASANEGDGKKGADGSLPGGRGFTLFDRQGAVLFDSGASTEHRSALYGHYPDGRSAAKGVEIESVASAVIGGQPHLFVGSERGSFIEVYRVSDPRRPEWLQLLPSGMSPEGLTTVTQRADKQHLLVSANEVDGSINIYRRQAAAPAEPQLVAKSLGDAWGALSGLTTDGTHLYAVPDNAFEASRIWRIDPAQAAQGRLLLDQTIMLKEADGSPVKADPEGIAWVADGFWIASEGASVDGNQLIKVDRDGVVQQRVKLPDAIAARFASPKIGTGYEGVAASADGQTLYLALQRGFDPAQPQAAILRYHLPTQAWTTALYPLEQHSQDAKKYWMGLSEIQLTSDGRLLLLERDKGGGEARAATAEVKRVYSVAVADLVEGALLKKTLVRDLRRDHNYLHEKAEGMVVYKGDLWVVNDNDGAGWTRWLNAGKP